jgi:tetratricopeptide (TPR) repeat protein
MKLMAWLVSVILTPVMGIAGIAAQQAPPARFDMVVRADFFAGFAGDEARLKRAMETCERTLAEDPAHAEAMVWHGSGLFIQAGAAFRQGDTARGLEMFSRAIKEMDDAVALAPDNVAVRIPRGAVLLNGSRFMPPDQATPLIQKAIGDYEKTLAVQTANGTFATLGDHPKGELLFGLAEGYSRLGQPDKARLYFEQLLKDAGGSGHVPHAQAFLATGTPPAVQGLGCVGCHK